MAHDHESDERTPAQSPSSARPDDLPVLDRVQELAWAYIDDQLSSDELRLLENLLLSDDAARDVYLGCVQLHVDLIHHFAEPATVTPCTPPAVLNFLNEGGAPFSGSAPTPEESHS